MRPRRQKMRLLFFVALFGAISLGLSKARARRRRPYEETESSTGAKFSIDDNDDDDGDDDDDDDDDEIHKMRSAEDAPLFLAWREFEKTRVSALT